jgi:peptidoglycan/LPS O-acetylase OafA/YrhL
MSRTHLPFIDWMKCLGMFVIVYGHVAAWSSDHLTPPIYPKQLGVAFFLFVLGFSLAREARPTGEVLYNRLFDIFLFGITFALVLSACTYVQTSWLEGSFAPRVSKFAASNYEPFVLGVNVVLDNFPANPTTWYIGTYLHVLLVWALVLRGIRVRPWMLLLVVLGEIGTRAALMETRGLFVAYMLLTNWATTFLLGTYFGQRKEAPRPGGWLLPLGCALGLGLLVLGWPAAGNGLVKERSFPFMRLGAGSGAADLAVTAAAVSALYLLYTALTYGLVRRLPDLAVVRFFARNTLIIFIIHMPIFYWTRSFTLWAAPDPLARVALRLVLCFLLPAVASELIYRVVRPRALRDKLRLLCLSPRPGRGLEKTTG